MTDKEWKELRDWVKSLENNKIYWTCDNTGSYIEIETDCESSLKVYKNGDLIFTKYDFNEKDDNYEEQSFVLKRNCNSSMINQIITIFGKQGR